MKYYIYLMLAPMVLSSCYHVYYAPNTANTPLLTQKGEVRINGLIASGAESEFVGGELQAAYAVSKNWGVMLNGFTGGKSENTGTYMERGSGSYIEAGTGFFTPISSNKKWIAELYGGIGKGAVSNEYERSDHSKVAVTKLFLQPAIGYRSRFIEVAVAPKLSQLNLKVKDYAFYASENKYEKTDVDHILQKPGMFAFEPAFIFRGGGENFKIQLGISFCNMSPFFYTQVNESCNASIGVSINVGGRK